MCIFLYPKSVRTVKPGFGNDEIQEVEEIDRDLGKIMPGSPRCAESTQGKNADWLLEMPKYLQILASLFRCVRLS